MDNSKKVNDFKKEQIKIVPFKNRYLKIFKGNSYYLLDQYKYDLSAIMMLLDLTKINSLEKIFHENKEGIEKVKFIKSMKTLIPSNPNDIMDMTNLIYGLYKFFSEIDFNGDGKMQWEEFTEFIIDTVEGDNEAKVDEDEENKINKFFNEKNMIKYKRYSLSTKLKDSIIHKKIINSAVFLPRIDLILVSEYGSKTIRTYNPKTGFAGKDFDIDIFLKEKENRIKVGKYSKSYRKNNDIRNNNVEVQNDFKSTNSYSVISLTQTCLNLIAVCLSDNRILFFSFDCDKRGELLYELRTEVLEKRCWYLPEHNIWFASGCKLKGYDYYTLNELDVEFELTNQKLDCYYNEGIPYRNHYCHMNPHRGEILDVIEIYKPMLILTACMDGKIRLLNLNEKEMVKIWENHTLGVRSLDYNPLIDSVGYVVSVGFEYYINVFCTDLSIEEAYKGRLEGHYAPVITCKFLSHSYMAVSLDEEGNVRIWDTKLRLCLQLIPTPKKNFNVANLLCLSKYNRFIVYGNKMFYFESIYKEDNNKKKKKVKDENYPIKVDFNKYYRQFFVTTFKDVKIYNKDGVLFKCFKKLKDNEHFESDTKIKYLQFQDNYRKFYLGYTNGAVMQFNAGNGSLIKAVNEKEIERDGIQTYKYDHVKEISSMFYFYDYSSDDTRFILFTTSYDSLINMYNEKNPEETEKLRTIRGGHTIKNKANEIICLDFSFNLNLFATGSTDRLVVIWDFELSKIVDICYLPLCRNDKIIVNYLKFLDPYPIVMAAYSDGTFYFWGVRPSKYRGKCILRGRNFYKIGHKIELSSIQQIEWVFKDLDNLDYNVPLKKYFDRDSPFSTGIDYDPPERKNSFDEGEEIDDNYLDIVLKIYKKDKEIIDDTLSPERYESFNTKKYFIIIGDSKGNLKIYDIKGIIRKYEIEPASKVLIKSSFNILKKDDINMETILNFNLETKENAAFPQFVNFYEGIIRREWKAHEDEITSLLLINEPLSFVSTSKDKMVKIWNFQCECIGVINTLPKLARNADPLIEWKFKVNEEKILEAEIAEVVRIFEEVGLERIEIGSKDDERVQREIVEENEEKKEVVKRIKGKINKKRFRPKSKGKKYNENEEDEGKNNISYERMYVQDIQNKIEKAIANDVKNEGINGITINAIKRMVEEKALEPKKQIPKEYKTPLMKSLTFGTSNKNFILDNKMNTLLPNEFKELIHPLNKKVKTVVPFDKLKLLPNIEDNITTQSHRATMKTFQSSQRTLNRTGNLKKSKHNLFNSKVRDTFYIEKFLAKNKKYSECKSRDNIFAKTKISTNNEFHSSFKKLYRTDSNRKIIFQRGETEKLLNFEFYINSYKKCFNGDYSNKHNKIIKKNYDKNWDYVNNFKTGAQNNY